MHALSSTSNLICIKTFKNAHVTGTTTSKFDYARPSVYPTDYQQFKVNEAIYLRNF